ncbi:hypothetical protein [Pyruvatibacter sp.]|uniref:hypothetical protein n=1 Tax=Pyruvatibacter sp. TaxID=1981328 RepID=UPI0032F096F8
MKPIFFKADGRLKRLFGRNLPSTIPPALEKKANAAIQNIAPEVAADVHARAQDLYRLTDGLSDITPDQIQTVFETAHELRGVCGTVGLFIPGGIANALCAYIEELQQARLMPRANIIWLHVSSLKRALNEDTAADTIGTYLIESLRDLRNKELEATRQEFSRPLKSFKNIS